MTIHVSSSLAAETVKVRWQEPYVTSGLNQKAFGQLAKGVFAGFTVVPGAAALTVDIQADAVLGISGANVSIAANKYCVTVVLPSTETLTLPSNNTVYIALSAQYQIGTTSTAQLQVVDAAELVNNPELVLLAKVTVPIAGVIPASAINMGYRQSAGDAVARESLPPFNLVANSGFERDAIASAPMGWVSSNVGLTTSVSGVSPHTGGLHSMLVNSGGIITANVSTGPMPVTRLETYRVGGWLRSVAPGIVGGSASLQVEWFDAANAPISVTSIEGTFTGSSGTWVERKTEVAAPELAATAKLKVAFNACSGPLYVDDVFFLTRRQDQLATTAVFGGSTFNADTFHGHSSASSAYAGGDDWADNTTNPATTVEAQLDKIVTDLAGASGAPKIGNAPSKILNNVFVNGVADTAAIDATGNGTGAGVVGLGGNTGPSGFATRASGAGVKATGGTGNAHGVVGQGGGATFPGTVPYAFANCGVIGVGMGAGEGVVGVGAATNDVAGISGFGSTGVNGIGVKGFGTQAGAGITGEGGSTGQGVKGTGGSSAGAVGVEGFGSTNASGGPGVVGRGTGTGALSSGGKFLSSATAATGTPAIYGEALNTNGIGVWAEATGNQPAILALADQVSSTGNGVTAYSVGGVGVLGVAASGAAGLRGEASGGGPSIQAGANGDSDVALEIESNADTIKFGSAKTMSCVLLPNKFNVYSSSDVGGGPAVSVAHAEDVLRLDCPATGVATPKLSFYSQVNLPYGARITAVATCVYHNGQATFSDFRTRLLKKVPNGTGFTTSSVYDVNEVTSLSVGSSTQVISGSTTVGAPDDTIDSLDAVLYVAVDGTLVAGVAAFLGVIYVKITYTMTDWLQLP